MTSTVAAAVDVRGLRKSYRSRLRSKPRMAVDGLDLHVPSGGRVHGFLGPNGSGKTTTLRALVGLVHADAGELFVLGRAVPDQLPTVIGGIGALIEAPQFFRAFSGRRNLRYLADVAGLARGRVDAVLDVVDLADRADDPVRGYSLGMRQRLAIAAALLKQPRLLLLDEPSNGLDPEGIRDVRALLRRLAADGTTILLSSHLLAEVEQVCDEVTIVTHGRTVVTGRVSDVLARATTGGARVRIRVADSVSAERVLRRVGFDVVEDGPHLVVAGADDPARVTQTLAASGLYLSELTGDTVGLEEAYLALTADDDRGA